MLEKAILGFDFGMKRIGVAVGHTLTKHARALCVLKAENGVPDWCQIGQLIEEWQIKALVVGIPHHMDGRVQHTTIGAENFAKQLQTTFQLPVFCVDERLTSVQARQNLQERTKRAVKQVDSEAAAIILQSWLYAEETRN